MRRPRLLDLFCGGGGAAMGYHRAGFDVVGVDHRPQPYFPFPFHEADALDFPLDGFDAIHASPPCQAYSRATAWRGQRSNHPDLLAPVLARLQASGLPWVLENVPDAPVVPHFVLCGSQFGLRVRRHRYFLTSWNGFGLLPPCDHRALLAFMHKGERAYGDAMGCTWMPTAAHRNAIPPAYTEWIGRQLLAHLTTGAGERHPPMLQPSEG
jgi:hypothetical protein